jgi:hypothetical protein
MNIHPIQQPDCCSTGQSCTCDDSRVMLPLASADTDNKACCGPPPGPESSLFERPGYTILQFVETFLNTPVGTIPLVKTQTGFRDWMGTIKARLGIGRDQYKVSPGLYGIGQPDSHSPVLVSANYKLSLDVLRKALKTVDAWILVVDTRGINVWCAAGKKLFSSQIVTQWVKHTGLERLVDHRRLILPQLSATGVSAHQVKKHSGFEVIWGPVRAVDIPVFLKNGMNATHAMRQVSFSFIERLVLIPVEISLLRKHLIIAAVIACVISGIGKDVFSFSAVWSRGIDILAALTAGIVAGTIMTPIFLPWLPSTRFSVKGATIGLMIGACFPILGGFTGIESISLILISGVVSSFLAMNFTGSTPFTSPSGVEKEMRSAIPVQIVGMLMATVLWVTSAFV